MVDEEVAREVRVSALHRHEPRHRDRGEERKRRPPQEPQDRSRLPADDEPDQQDKAGKDEADEPLGENAERSAGPGEQDRVLRGLVATARDRRVGAEHDGEGDACRHQDVEVGVLRRAEEERHGDEHQHGRVRQGRPDPAPEDDMEAQDREQGGAHGRQPRRRQGAAQGPDRQGGEPVEQRRLVEERQAVLGRHDPVARARHLPGDADVSAFVRQHQRVQADGKAQPNQDRHGNGQERSVLASGRGDKKRGRGQHDPDASSGLVAAAWPER
jgi:hypothetical protein